MNCYYCGKELNKANKSDEHVIPNALGGKLKSDNLLCKDCNSILGSECDDLLTKQFAFFSQFLLIKRQRGKNPGVCLKNNNGTEYILDGANPPRLKHPVVSEETNGIIKTVRIECNPNETDGIIKTYKRKKNAVLVQRGFNQDTQDLGCSIEIGGEALLAVLKIAINYYLHENGDCSKIKRAIDNLRKKDYLNVKPIQLDRSLFEHDEDLVFHSIWLHSGSKMLYAVVTLFSFFHFLVALTDEYTGNEISSLYVLDAINGIEFEKVKNTFTPEYSVLDRCEFGNDSFFDYIQKITKKLLSMGISIRDNRLIQEEKETISKTIAASWQSTVDQLISDGGKITQESINLFFQELGRRLMEEYRNKVSGGK